MSISRIGQGGEFEPNGTDIIQQIATINLGFDLGLTFIDTAEIYGDGFSEEMIGQAIHKKRSAVFVASKFSPENAAYKDVVSAAERTLRRLKTDYIDLYQVHWPNPKIPISETMSAM